MGVIVEDGLGFGGEETRLREREDAWEMERERRGLRGLMSLVAGGSWVDEVVEEDSGMGVGVGF